MKKILIYVKILVLTLISYQSLADDVQIKPQILENVRKAVVTIDSRISLSAYRNTGKWTGTGFIADKQQGIIITNAHIVAQASIGSYFVTFHTGQQTEAKAQYYDLWQDFAILRVNPADIPDSVTFLDFGATAPKPNQHVFIIGNNEAQGFSFHTGYLTNLYDITGDMPQHSYIISLNSAGGSSGSPLIDENGKVIGLHYGGSRTYGISLKGEYITEALNYIKKSDMPKRQHIGAICELYSLDKAVKHRNFPKALITDYLKQFPDTRNRAISIYSTLNRSPASQLLKSGDIIWEINGKQIGASLFDLDHIMNDSKNTVQLTIFRNGEKLKVDVPLYDINKHKINRIIDFGGATFFDADDWVSSISGIPLGTLSIFNIQKGSSFSAIPTSMYYQDNIYYRVAVNKINQYSLSNLTEFIKVINDISSNKFIKMELTNYQPYFQFNETVNSSHESITCDIDLDSVNARTRLFEFNPKSFDWEEKEIGK